jgi:hypothetical protein
MDCLEGMKLIQDNYIDTVISDPPYGLEFMGKEWDKKGIAFNINIWEEVLRITKPGGYLLAFGGSRTQHRLVSAIEDAGWIIKDTLIYMYGSGFPKSLDIGKQIDKKAKKDIKIIEEKKELGKWLRKKRGNKSQKEIAKYFLSYTGGLTGCVSNWEKGYNLPTWEIWIKLKKILKLDDRYDYLIEDRPKNFIAAKREIKGKKDYSVAINHMNRMLSAQGNIGRIKQNITAPSTPGAKTWDGYGTALKPAIELICLAMKKLDGTYAENCIKWKTGGLNIDIARIGNKGGGTYCNNRDKNGKCLGHKNVGRSTSGEIFHAKENNINKGRWPANLILDNESAELLDDRSGELSQCGGEKKTEHKKGIFGIGRPGQIYREGERGASRYFQKCNYSRNDRFYYTAKVSSSERNKACEGVGGEFRNTHPT